MEAQLCLREEVCVVGGGNSAGQAAIYLSRHASHVYILVRSNGLAASMSDYLIQRIEASPHITLLCETEITGLAGEDILREVTWTNRAHGACETKTMGNVFVMIGAEPNTDWLKDCLDLDCKGFVLTGADAATEKRAALMSPYCTSQPGVFAVGDVRAGSVKRVASGVGEGSVVVQAIHKYLNPQPA
jgi:thioredoxin reductase (NADPH)